MSVTNGKHQLRDYLRKRLEYLERCNAEFNSQLDEQRRLVADSLDDGTYSKDDPELRTIVHHLDCVLANTFRYTMLVGLCSYLEETLAHITRSLVPDYDTTIKSQKGNWLAKHTRVLADVCGIALDPVDGDIKTFHDLIAMRNCVVHQWGKVDAAKKPPSVKDAVDHIETAEISRDGFLYFGDQVLPEAIVAAENIADHILVAQFDLSIT